MLLLCPLLFMFSPQACAEKHLSLFHTEASLNPVFDSGTTSLGDGGLLQQAEFSVHVNLNFFFFDESLL